MKKWIITFGGAGFSPVAPGTAGSIAATGLLCLLFATGAFNTLSWNLLLLGLLVLFSALCVWLGPYGIAYFGRKDPGGYVLDEAAGICLSCLFLPIYDGPHEAGALLIALLAFRLFDVTKPPPARQLEKLPAGWGILMDDLAAAVYANVLAQVLVRVLIPLF